MAGDESAARDDRRRTALIARDAYQNLYCASEAPVKGTRLFAACKIQRARSARVGMRHRASRICAHRCGSCSASRWAERTSRQDCAKTCLHYPRADMPVPAISNSPNGSRARISISLPPSRSRRFLTTRKVRRKMLGCLTSVLPQASLCPAAMPALCQKQTCVASWCAQGPSFNETSCGPHVWLSRGPLRHDGRSPDIR